MVGVDHGLYTFVVVSYCGDVVVETASAVVGHGPIMEWPVKWQSTSQVWVVAGLSLQIGNYFAITVPLDH